MLALIKKKSKTKVFANFGAPPFRDTKNFGAPPFRDTKNFGAPTFRDTKNFGAPTFRDTKNMYLVNLPFKCRCRLQDDSTMQQFVQ